MLAWYTVLRPYDLVSVMETPRNEITAKIFPELGSYETVEIMTRSALPIEIFAEKVKGK